MMLPSFVFTVSAEKENISLANVVTEDSKLVFDGFTLQYGTNGKIQALVDVSIENIDATIIAQRPKMRPHIDTMRENIKEALGIELDQINVKATTEEGLGFTGSEEGISAQAICLLR